MDKKDLTTKLSFLSNNHHPIGFTLYFLLKSDDKFELLQADIERDTVEQKLRTQFLESLQRDVIDNEDLNFVNLSIADSRKDTAYFYDFDEKPEGFTLIESVLQDENQPPFDFKKNNITDLFGFVIVLGNERNKVVLFKKHHAVNLLVRDSFFFFQDNTRLVNSDDEIIRINETFDFLFLEETIVILNLNILEKFFGFHKVIHNKAKQNIELIGKSNLLVNVKLLEELSENTRFAKKLMKVKSNSAVFGLHFVKVRDFIRQHPKLKKKVRFNTNGSKIKLDTNVSAELFLKLLDDDFLKSELTDYFYETDTKNLLKIMDENDAE